MAQRSSLPSNLSADFDHHVVLFPTRSAAHVLDELSEQSPDRTVAGPPAAVRTHVVGEVTVLQVAGLLDDVVEDLDRALELALAEEPRAVVCDLSTVCVGAEPEAVEMLATAGRHVRDWSGIPVAVACPDPLVREALSAHPLGGRLIVTASMPAALSAVLATPTPATDWLQLEPKPSAPRSARDFVTRTLLDWDLDPLTLSAGLVVSELVANSTHTGTDIDVSVAWDQGALRLTVRDNSPDLPRQPFSHLDPYARRLSVVAVLSRAFGVLPTADGGKVVWAVLNAARPRPSTGTGQSESTSTLQT